MHNYETMDQWSIMSLSGTTLLHKQEQFTFKEVILNQKYKIIFV